MKSFKCPKCRSRIYFKNTVCNECNTKLGFDATQMEFSVAQSSTDFSKNTALNSRKYCANFEFGVCNWLVTNENDTYCKCCQLNGDVPDISDSENHEKWQKLELAKHRLVYQLLMLNFPVVPKSKDKKNGILFNFLGKNNPEKLMTGHSNGTITILLNEADSVEREQLRKQMSEPYRTLIGHFRHEIGHYYWPFLITKEKQQEFRAIFGDESVDYGEALKKHYAKTPSNEWKNSHISSYASSHAWEDWAETWAHYLHIMDTLETAAACGVGLSFDNNEAPPVKCPNPYLLNDFREILKWGGSLALAANSLNRSMGMPDIYPFVIPESVYLKLNFIHTVSIAKRNH